MVDAGEKHERTLAFAEVALRQIKALRKPAEPRDYELWYTYATGYNLNKAVNDAPARKGNLSPAEVHAIHDTYFGSARSSERIESVGAQVADEIDQVMVMIDSAVGTTTSYSETLADAPVSSAAAWTGKSCAQSSKAWCKRPRSSNGTVKLWSSG